MRVEPEIFWEEETPQSERLNFIIIKFGASTACVDERNWVWHKKGKKHMINKVILMGRLTKDPELRHTNNQTPVCSFGIAVSNGYGEKQQTDFINCVAWNKTAEFVSKYFGKGKMIIVIGRIATRSWETQDGKRAYATEVVANEVTFGETKRNQADTVQDDDFTPLDEYDEDLPF